MEILEYNALNNNYSVNYKILSKKVYKLLPLYEGKVKDSDIKLQPEIALKNFYKNIDVLTCEMRGILSKIEFHKSVLEVLLALEGLREVDGDSHTTVRNVVLHCVNLLNEIGG